MSGLGMYELGVGFGGGHMEITQRLDRPILVGQMLGEVVPTRDAQQLLDQGRISQDGSGRISVKLIAGQQERVQKLNAQARRPMTTVATERDD